MENIYSTCTEDELWLIKEIEFVRELQGIREAQFTLGNGYLGIRGVYEEIPYDCHPGTYVAGLYDKMTAQVSELVNLPNPVNFKFTVKGEKLGVIAMDIIEHKRALNMKKALLARYVLYKDSKGKRYNYQSLRFISQHDKNIGVMRIALTPLDAECVMDVTTGIDTSISNTGVLSEGRKRHFRIKELGQFRSTNYLVAETFEKKHAVIYWAGFYYQRNGKKVIARDNVFCIRLKKNQEVIFTKVFCIKHFPYKNSYFFQKRDAFRIFHKAFQANFSELLKKHIDAWDKLWKKADIVIERPANIQQNLRFNIYHMLICIHCDQGSSSIGARTLSGEGYRGHIFWDSEIFLFPFYLFTFPRMAKDMLLYRYRRLDKARKIAEKGGYRGAQFPWESADTGGEETPEWARDIDRTIIKIHTHEMEHHIVADIAYAVYKYYQVTRDKKFMEDYGYEMLIETARFWASRVEYNKKKDSYEIKRIIGPDEFHVGVNNNAFTNIMAKWNLFTVYKICREIKAKHSIYKRLKDKLNFRETETKEWKRIASKIGLVINKKKVIEQFDGYFRLKKIILAKTDENGIPLLPAKMKAKNLGKTQLVKQADVLMLLSLLSDVFSAEIKTANYNFYISRTVHKSSLSPSMHAFIACETGDLQRAYNFFNVALRTDISNLYGNTPEGIHGACLGGTWQAVVFGFAGVKIKRDNIYINPRMPHSWQKLIFPLIWQGSSIKLELTNETIKLKVVSAKRKSLKVGIFNKLVIIGANKTYIFKRRVRKHETEEYY